MNSKIFQIVVCGTDTDVGKTIISSLLVQGLNAIYWKPIQSGMEDGGDTHKLHEILTLPQKRYLPEKYKFKAAVSPHWAAEQENTVIDPQQIRLPNTKQHLIIEMAGGVMVPLNRNYLQIDLLKEWKLPIILVARSGLGTLNHTLLTLEALKTRSIPTLGIILNGELHKDNPKTLEQFSGIPIIAQLPKLASISAKSLSEQWLNLNLNERLKTAFENHSV